LLVLLYVIFVSFCAIEYKLADRLFRLIFLLCIDRRLVLFVRSSAVAHCALLLSCLIIVRCLNSLQCVCVYRPICSSELYCKWSYSLRCHGRLSYCMWRCARHQCTSNASKLGLSLYTLLTLPSGWSGYYTCPALRPYRFGPMRNPDVTKGHSDRL